MAILNDLRQLLQKEFPGADVKLTTVRPGGRVGGSLIWDGFDGQAQIDRQQRLHQVIGTLPVEQQLKVSFILTITNDEHAVMTRT